MITIDKHVIYNRYDYFLPEIAQLENKESIPEYVIKEIEKGIPDSFYEKRKTGEEEDFVCKLIRNDSVEEFITYFHENNFPLQSEIQISLFDTNNYISRYTSIIEYAAFHGSVKIFNYLIKNVNLLPRVWLYAIHGQNSQIIHILEENEVQPPNSYIELFYEAAKCHHNNIADYIADKYFTDDEKQNIKSVYKKCLEYYNFSFIQKEMIDESVIFDLCRFDYYILFDFLLQNKNIDVNQKEIYQML